MAEIVLGIGTSHGPQLITTVEDWSLRVAADRQNALQYFRGRALTFDQLVQLRARENLGAYIAPEEQWRRHARNDAALHRLTELFRESQPDVAVIVANDQNECFSSENSVPFCIHRGASFENIPKTPQQIAQLPPGIAPTALGYCPPVKTSYRGVPGLAVHLIETLTSDGFDVAQTSELPMGPQGSNSIQHAFGFVYRRIMCDDVVPNVPIIVNTHYPPNRPSPARCVAFGTSLAQAIASWPQDMRVVVIASGGLTHYVIDEDFDRGVLDAMSRGDLAFLASIEENMLQSGGTAELKNWLPVAAAMKAAGLAMNLIDYVPCYRSEAGTGAGMAFATWSKSGEVSGP